MLASTLQARRGALGLARKLAAGPGARAELSVLAAAQQQGGWQQRQGGEQSSQWQQWRRTGALVAGGAGLLAALAAAQGGAALNDAAPAATAAAPVPEDSAAAAANGNRKPIKTSGMKLFSGNANQRLAAEIAGQLGMNLGKITVSRFADGEVNVMVHENVRGKDVYIVQVC